MKGFRRIQFWWAYIFGGGYDHPTRGMGGMRSIFWRTREWKLHTFKGEVSWWGFCKPPSILSDTGQRQDRFVRSFAAGVDQLPAKDKIAMSKASIAEAEAEQEHLKKFFMGGK